MKSQILTGITIGWLLAIVAAIVLNVVMPPPNTANQHLPEQSAAPTAAGESIEISAVNAAAAPSSH